MTSAEAAIAAVIHGLVPLERELLVFAAFWFVVGLVDEFAVDLTWLWLRLTGRARTPVVPHGYVSDELSGGIAVFVPAFREAGVIAMTIAHMAQAWPQKSARFYIGCYANDPDTLEAAMEGAGTDARVRLVVHHEAGPTTKADCLNRLYAALRHDEQRRGKAFRGVVLQDAEDMVHPCGLKVIDVALGDHDFVQLPVRPALDPASRWIGGHYADEFTEAHAKALVVRSALGAAIPAAGVGCGFSREALHRLAERRGLSEGPFATDCLTEDYELGMILSREGRGSTFLRLRDADGTLIATSSYFPGELATSVRQKTRWIHGIAFQGWDRMGWSKRPIELWMALRDRRGPLTAIVLMAAYALLAIEAVLLAAKQFGLAATQQPSYALEVMLALTLAGCVWRLAMRIAFTGREYGWAEAARSVLRLPVANIIAIMAGRRALTAYVRSLTGQAVVWDKTTHLIHPAMATPGALGIARPAGEASA